MHAWLIEKIEEKQKSELIELELDLPMLINIEDQSEEIEEKRGVVIIDIL